MSESKNTRKPESDPRDERPEPRRAAGEPRLTPTVRFGLQAAVLAGVIVLAGSSTVGMGGAINTMAAPDTTCCGISQVSRAM